MQHLSLDARLRDLPLHAAALDIRQPGQAAIDLFEAQPALPGILLWSRHKFLGAVSRHYFFERMSRPYSQELYARRPLEIFQTCNSPSALVLAAETAVVPATNQVLQRPGGQTYEPIVVQFDATDYRLLNAQDLLLAHAEVHRLTELQLRQQTAKLEHTVRDLQQAQTHLIQAEKMSALGQMVAGIAHEVNNPISFVYGNIAHVQKYSQDLLDLVQLYQLHYPAPSPEIAAAIEDSDLDFLSVDLEKTLASMRLGASRVREIVRNLRTFSHLDEAQTKQVCLNAGLDSTLLILQHRLRQQGDRPEIQVCKHYGELPQIECYAGQINQVFLNLLSNAIDAIEARYARETDLEPKIEIRTALQVVSDPSQQIVIQIADNGIGMDAEVHQRLFTPFFTTKPVGKGTGLGLAISYPIVVEKHGGQIDCQSELGVGTTFRLVIPAALPTMPTLAG